MEEEIKQTVEINKEIANELFNIAGLKIPEKYSEEAFFECIFKLKSLVNPETISEEEGFQAMDRETNNILVVDDIGIVTYQLKILLKNIG